MKKYSAPSQVVNFRNLQMRQKSPRKEIHLPQEPENHIGRNYSVTPSTYPTQSSQCYTPSLIRGYTPDMMGGAQYREALQNQLELMKKLKEVVIDLEKVEEDKQILQRENKRLTHQIEEILKKRGNKENEVRLDEMNKAVQILSGLYEKERTKNHALIEDLEQCAMTRNRAYYEIQKMIEFLSDLFEFLFASAYPASKIGDCSPVMLQAQQSLNHIHSLYLEKLKSIGANLPALNLAPQIAKVISAQWRKPIDKLHKQLYNSPIVSILPQTSEMISIQRMKGNQSLASSPPSSPPPTQGKKRRNKTCVVFATPHKSISVFQTPPLVNDSAECSHCVLQDSSQKRGEIQSMVRSNKISRKQTPLQKQMANVPSRIYSPSQNPPLSSQKRKQSPFKSQSFIAFHPEPKQIGRKSLSHFQF